jgi:ATP citrate (pro-S)-lyase
MPSLKLSEYQIKKLFGLNPQYININKLDLSSIDSNYVIKVDNGIKHRMHNGLVKINIDGQSCYNWVLEKNTNDNYIVEEPVSFSQEYYVSIRPLDTLYNQLLFSTSGGINLDNPEHDCIKFVLNITDTNMSHLDHVDIPSNILDFLEKLYSFYLKYHFTFLETNPIVFNTRTQNYIPLDMTGTIDTDAIYLFSKTDREIVEMPYIAERLKTPEELAIQKLDERTGASLKFTMLNPMGTIWTLIAGGGASVVYTDAIVYRGYRDKLANYGEYSGDPQEELVEEYCNQIFTCMGRVSEEKILFIGGAIANFTDVYATFSGIIKAIHKNNSVLRDTKVYIRRGGPNDIKALEAIKTVLDSYSIYNKTYNSNTNITKIVELALPKLDMQINTPINTSLDNLDMTYNSIDTINSSTKCGILGFHKNAIQRMLDFDYMCGKLEKSVVCIIEPRQSKETMEPFFYGDSSILIPVYKSVKVATANHSVDIVINFLSFRSAYDSTLELLETDVKTVVIIAEGIPELMTRRLKLRALELGKTIIGPATVGGIFGGQFRIANTGGSNENLIRSGLFNKGNVGFITRSGGLLNELCSIISRTTSGVHSGISIGGDRYPCTSFLDIAISYENNKEIDLIVCLGELGGVEELKLAQAKSNGLITKPVIAYCIGISSDLIGSEVQFGHAGSSATCKFENAIFKNSYMRNANIIVPDSFEELEECIKANCIIRTLPKKDPKPISSSRKMPIIYSSVSNETGEELTYNNIPISELLTGGIGKTIGHLWLKRELPEWFSKYIELVLIITADHGAMVSGAMNTIVSSRANRDLISSLCSGLLTIGDRFGGALNESAKQFKNAIEKYTPSEFIDNMKRDNILIMGIGHKVKTLENPDIRVKLLKEYVEKHFPTYDHVKYALEVEKLTTMKKNNLILNVDGFVANSLLDAFSLIMSNTEVDEIIENDFINSFFILGRSIGFIGHWYDQRRLKQGLFRMPENLVQYI